MLPNELEILEKLVLKEPEKTSEIPKENFEKYNSIVLEESFLIKQKYLKTAFDLKESNLISIYVQNQHNNLLTLSDKIYSQLSKEDPLLKRGYDEPCLTSAQFIVYNATLELLNFLETQFSHYLNDKEKLPEGIKYRELYLLKEKITELQVIADYRYPELLRIIIESINKVFNKPQISKSEITYSHKLIEVFIDTLNYEYKEDYFIFVIKKLISIDFNALPFFDYVTTYIENHIDSIDSKTDKLEQYLWYYKEVKKMYSESNFTFNKDGESIKYIFSNWLEEEISFMEKSLKFSVNKNGLAQNAIQHKILTSLSVHQMAIIYRAFHDCNFILNQNEKELMKIVASTHQSKKAENISEGSLLSKYYKINNQVKEDVKHILLEMVRYVQKL